MCIHIDRDVDIDKDADVDIEDIDINDKRGGAKPILRQISSQGKFFNF